MLCMEGGVKLAMILKKKYPKLISIYHSSRDMSLRNKYPNDIL